MAITRATVRDINLKKEYAALVHEGEKAGGAQVMIQGAPMGDDISFAFNMPKGEFTGPEISESMRVALYGQRFANMTADERRTFLFELTKCKRNAEAVKARMLAPQWACQAAKIDAVLPLLRTGFPSVCDHAKSKATEAKGAWRQLTGETYGAVKAASWVADIPEKAEGDAVALAEQVAGLDKIIATQNESLGAIKSIARTAQDAATKRASLAEAAGKVPNLADQLERAKAERDEYLPKVESLRQRAAGKARVGLVHDMAIYLDGQIDRSEVSDGQQLLARYEKEHGALSDVAKIDTEAQAALPEHEEGLRVLENRAKNLQRDLEAAMQAKAQYDALEPAGEALDASAELAEVEGLLATAKADRQRIENQRLDIVAADRKRAEAKAKTDAALAHHTDVAEWTKVADSLAPDGIPSEILAEALTPVNATLAQAAVDAEWMKVEIGADMAITADGRPYQLLSESEQWRADAMIAQVVAELSGLKILMLDRVDVLDLPGRAQLFNWMDTLAELDLVDTVLLFATLKELPTGLGESVQCHWVENGTIAGQRQQEAA